MATLERLGELAKKVRSGSILDVQGFLAQAHDQALAGEIIEALRECGLLDLCSFPYEAYFEEDVAEFYLTATVQGSVIISVVNGQRLEIREADIRNAFNLPPESRLEKHCYDQRELWNRIRGEGTSEEPRLSGLKKTMLKPEFERLVDIVYECLDCRLISAMDDVTPQKIAVLSAIMQKIKVNWARYIFHRLIHFITTAKPLVNNLFKNYVGYGLLIGHLLKEKGVVLRKRENVGNDRYLLFKVGATKSRKRARTSSSKSDAQEGWSGSSKGEEDDPELLGDLKRVKAWRGWRLDEYDAHSRIALEMEEEELFALNWLGITDVAEATKLERINEVYLNKLGKKRDEQMADKGKGKMPDVEREGEEQTDPAKEILSKFTHSQVENTAVINKALGLVVDSQNQLKNQLKMTSEKLILDMEQYFNDFLKKYKAEGVEFRKFIETQIAELLSVLHQQQNKMNDLKDIASSLKAELETTHSIVEDIRRQQVQNSMAIQFLCDAARRRNAAFIPEEEEGVNQEAEEEEESTIESTDHLLWKNTL